MKRSIISTLALVAAVVTTSPTMAQDVPTVHVSYADLNLSDPAGAKVFNSRLQAAVKAVCGYVEPSDLFGQAAVSACRRKAWMSAKAQADRVLASRGGAPITLAVK